MFQRKSCLLSMVVELGTEIACFDRKTRVRPLPILSQDSNTTYYQSPGV